MNDIDENKRVLAWASAHVSPEGRAQIAAALKAAHDAVVAAFPAGTFEAQPCGSRVQLDLAGFQGGFIIVRLNEFDNADCHLSVGECRSPEFGRVLARIGN